MIHQLKIEQEYFEAVTSGRKTFELRANDREYEPGDFLALNEIQADKTLPGRLAYTGRSCLVEVDYILQDEKYLQPGYVCMAIKPCGIARSKDDFSYNRDIYAVPTY